MIKPTVRFDDKTLLNVFNFPGQIIIRIAISEKMSLIINRMHSVVKVKNNTKRIKAKCPLNHSTDLMGKFDLNYFEHYKHFFTGDYSKN